MLTADVTPENIHVDWSAAVAPVWNGFFGDGTPGGWNYDTDWVNGTSPITGISGSYYCLCDGGMAAPPSGNVSNSVLVA